jgi:hypothetical protein
MVDWRGMHLIAGDTAQTIAAGVGFRFEDLKSIFQVKKLPHLPSVALPSVSPVPTLGFPGTNPARFK